MVLPLQGFGSDGWAKQCNTVVSVGWCRHSWENWNVVVVHPFIHLSLLQGSVWEHVTSIWALPLLFLSHTSLPQGIITWEQSHPILQFHAMNKSHFLFNHVPPNWLKFPSMGYLPWCHKISFLRNNHWYFERKRKLYNVFQILGPSFFLFLVGT